MAVKKIQCSKCGNLAVDSKYYISRAEKNSYYGKQNLCKTCLEELYLKTFNRLKDRKEAIIEFCSMVDIPFSENIYSMSINAFATRGEIDEYKLASTYLSFINSNVGKSAGTTFSESENFNRLFDEGGGFDSAAQFKFDRAQEEIIELNNQITNLTLENTSLSKENSLLKPENLKLQSKLTSTETEIASLKISNEQEVARKEGLKIKLESEITRLSSELNIAKLNLSDTSKKLKEKTDECDALQKTVNSYNKKSLVLENDAEYANKKLDEYTSKKEKELEELNEKYNEDVKKLKNRISELMIELEDEKNNNKNIEVESKLEENKPEIPKEYIFEWGEGFDLKDYQFMNEEATVWKEKHEIKNEAEELLLHEIIILKLQMRKKRATGDNNLKEDRASLQAMIRNAQFIKRESVNQQPSDDNMNLVGLWSKDIEDYSPAEWYNNHKKFRDIEGIDGYLKKHLTRPVKNFTTGSRDFDSGMDLLSGDDPFNE